MGGTNNYGANRLLYGRMMSRAENSDMFCFCLDKEDGSRTPWVGFQLAEKEVSGALIGNG